MNEEPKVSRLVTSKLKHLLNRERVEQRFDSSGLGVYRTHPLVVKLELAYLIANENEKKKKEKNEEASGEEEENGRGRKTRHSDEPTIPKVRSLPQHKTRVQMSEVNRLAKTAHSTLKTVDADKISTVYRFRQQMIPHEVRHQGKVKQISTSVHAMLNAKEAWRYRKDNDEREKVKKYREEQKEKEKKERVKAAKEQELARLPVGVRMEVKRQNKQKRNQLLLEKLLEPTPDHTPRSNQRPQSAAGASEDEFADEEQSDYDDDFEEVDDLDVEHDHGNNNENQGIITTDNENDAPTAAVTTADDRESISSVTTSTYTAAASPSLSMQSRSRQANGISYDETQEAAYNDDSFENDDDDDGDGKFAADDQSALISDVDVDSMSGSRSTSRAPSPLKSSYLPPIDDNPDDIKKINDKQQNTSDSHGSVQNKTNSRNTQPHDTEKPKGTQKLQRNEGGRPGSAEVRKLAGKLTKTAVRDAAHETGATLSMSTTSVRSMASSDGVSSKGGSPEMKRKHGRKMSQEYTRTESVVSLSDRVK